MKNQGEHLHICTMLFQSIIMECKLIFFNIKKSLIWKKKMERTKRKSCKRSNALYAYTESDERTELYIPHQLLCLNLSKSFHFTLVI